MNTTVLYVNGIDECGVIMRSKKEFHPGAARYPKPRVKITEDADVHREQIFVLSLHGVTLGQLKYSDYHSEWFWTPAESRFSNGEIRIDNHD